MRLSTRSLSVLLSVALFTPVALASFVDVPAAHQNFDAITYMETHKLVNGYDNGTFRPSQTVNRAELTKILTIVSGSLAESAIPPQCKKQQQEKAEEVPLTFSDVPGDAWFALYVCIAKTNHLVSGYPDGTFHPEKSVTFIETAKMLALSQGFQAPLNANTQWYEPFVLYLATKNAIPPTIDSLTKNITRGELAEMLYRVLAKITTKESRSDLLAVSVTSASASSTSSSAVPKVEDMLQIDPVPIYDTRYTWEISYLLEGQDPAAAKKQSVRATEQYSFTMGDGTCTVGRTDMKPSMTERGPGLRVGKNLRCTQGVVIIPTPKDTACIEAGGSTSFDRNEYAFYKDSIVGKKLGKAVFTCLSATAR